MSQAKKQSRTLLVLSAVVVLLMAAGVWGLVSLRGRSDAVALPENLTLAGIEAQMDDPEQMMKTMEKTWDRKDLTDEQRRQVFRNMRKAWETRAENSIDEWFKAPPEQKKAVLDKHIDQFQKARKVWEKNGERWRKRWEEERKRREAAGEQVDEDEGGPPRWGARMSTQQGRKSMAESGDPDRRARWSMYMGAFMARMRERGIQMPWGGRGGAGGRPRGGPPRR